MSRAPRGLVALLALHLLAVLPWPALAQADRSAGPILRIETGMHGADINRLAVTADGSELVTVSDDKTTRRWSLTDGKALGVWRTPIGEGDVGALYAVAAAGDTIVVGGRTNVGKGAALYVLDRPSGQMRGSIGGFGEAISALAFSRDGARLAIGQQGRGGLTLIDFAGHKMLAQDRAYADTVQWVVFAPDGRIATSSADGKLRIYDAALRLTAQLPLMQGSAPSRPWGLAFSPDGKTLAVGSLDHANVQLLDATTLRSLAILSGANTSGALSVVGWSTDGATLVGGGSYKDNAGRRALRFWHLHGNAVVSASDIGLARDTITDLALLPNGRAVYASAEPSFGVVDQSGQEALHRGAEHCDFRDAWQDALRISQDGATVDFPALQGGKAKFRFDLLDGTLTADPPARPDLRHPVTGDARLALLNWRNGAAPTLNGRGIALDPHELVRSVAILPGSTSAALGTDFYLRLEGALGELWRRIVPAPAWSVAASGDGRFVVAGLGDGTIRWYAASDGREVMSLFVDPLDARWVAWVPEGFFDHSADIGGHGGESLVGFQLNNGANRAADFVTIGQVYALFYRRDLVLAAFRGGGRDTKLVAAQLARVGDVRAVLTGGLPPQLALIEACIRPTGSNGCPAGSIKPTRGADRSLKVTGYGSELFARYRLDDRGGGIGHAVLRRGGAVIEGGATVESSDAKQRTETVVVPLRPDGDSIRLGTETDNAAIQSGDLADILIDARPTPDPAVAAAPATGAGVQLFVVAVGVSGYNVADFRLDNAANDARSLGEMLGQPSPPVYDHAEVTVLIDQEATAPNIEAALRNAAAKARPQDVVVLFFSGHGEAVDGKYFYAPVDFAARHPEQMEEARHADEARQGEIIDTLFREDGFGETQLLPLLEKIQGNLLLVLDTCYSATLAKGDAVGERARNETVARSVGHETGRFILAGARTLALDSSGNGGAAKDGHGLLTTYLLRGLAGDADLQHAGRVNVAELLMFTKAAVREQSRKLSLEQEPFFYFSGSNFFDIRAVATRR